MSKLQILALNNITFWLLEARAALTLVGGGFCNDRANATSFIYNQRSLAGQ